MNEVLDQGLPLHPLQIQRDTVRDYRQIGIGVMGIADMLIKIGIKYDTDEALEVCDYISFTLANESIKASALLAKEEGVYPKYNEEAILQSEFLNKNATIETFELVKKYGLRNSQLLTIAPTGSISTMIQVSGGIEPIFSFSYDRKTESLHGEERHYKVYTKIVKEYMEENNLNNEEELPDFFVNAQTIDPFKRVEMQGVWQEYIDASISSTINLPNEATVEEVEQLYMYAWEQGCKGLTIYRDGCARSGVLTLDNKKEEEEEVKELNQELKHGTWLAKPDDTIYYERKVYTGCSKLILFIGYSQNENRIVDVFVKHTSKGGCKSNIDGIVILMSGILRYGGNLQSIQKALEGVGTCNSFNNAKNKGMKLSKGSSCPTAILNTILEFEQEMKGIKPQKIDLLSKMNEEKEKGMSNEEKDFIEKYGETEFVKRYHKCPTCHSEVINTGGCVSCPNGCWSKCD